MSVDRRVTSLPITAPTAIALDHASAAASVGISPSRLRHHVRLGDISPHFSGTKPLYTVTDLQQFVEGLPTRPEHLAEV